MDINLQFVKEFVENNDTNIQNINIESVHEENIYLYCEKYLVRFIKSNEKSINSPIHNISYIENYVNNDENILNIKFIRILTRNRNFVERYFCTCDNNSLFSLLVDQYHVLIEQNSPKCEYVGEITKIISNTIIQVSPNCDQIKTLLESILCPMVAWLTLDCIFNNISMDCYHQHFRCLYLITRYIPSLRENTITNYTCITWCTQLYYFLLNTIDKKYNDLHNNTNNLMLNDYLITDKTMILDDTKCVTTTHDPNYVCKILFPCVNSLFILLHSISNTSMDFKPTIGELSNIFFYYMEYFSEIYNIYEYEPLVYTNFVSLLCNFMSCISNNVFDIFSIDNKHLLVTRILYFSYDSKLGYKGSYPKQFLKFNVSRIIFLIEIIENLVINVVNEKCDNNNHAQNSSTNHNHNVANTNSTHQLTGERSGDLIKILYGLIFLCKHDKMFRRYVRFQILPPLKNANIRPELENSLRGYFTKLLTTRDITLNIVVGEFLFVLCREDVDRLIKYVGMGNAMGYLHHRGLLSTNHHNDVLTSNNESSDNSDIEEYDNDIDKVNPITGAISCTADTNIPSDMPTTENDEEKLAQFNQAMDDIQKLTNMNIISPATITNDGKIVKFDQQPKK